MTAYAGTSMTGTLYRYYACNRARKKLCDKKRVNKQKIEDFVIYKIVELLKDEELLDRLAELLYSLQYKESTILPRLEEELCQKEKEIERIVDAIQKGIASDALMKRLAMLEEQKKVVEGSIEEEKEKSPVFTKDQFCMALYNFRKIDVNTQEGKRKLIDTFVNSIFLYDDRLKIVFNGGAKNEEISLSELESSYSIQAGQAESYAELDPKMRPSNAVVTVDDELNVLGAGGKEIGDFSTVFETLSSEGILTVVRLKNRVQADALSAWLIETDEFDLAAMSSDPAVVKYLKTKEKDIRGIADYSAKTAQDLDAAALVKEANENYCNAVLLSQGAATAETVAFFQARFKAVWLAADSAEEFNFYRCVSSGAYGILSDGEPETLYHYYDNYNINSIPRAYLNIAHRGMPYGYPENTLEGCIAAYEAGADAVEIDMKVSKDGEIFILHDSTLERTTDGQGNAEHMTLEQ